MSWIPRAFRALPGSLPLRVLQSVVIVLLVMLLAMCQ